MKTKEEEREFVKIESIVNMAFRDITAKGYFDIEKGNYPIPKVWNLAMKDIPLQMTNYVNECGYGCCFVFSAYMIDILNKYGIKAYMIGSSEGNGIRASVLYEKDGQYYVANPVEDIEYFTEHNISLKDREKYYIGDSTTMVKSKDNIHNAACYTLEEFSKKYGSIWYIGSMNKDDNSTLEEEFTLMKKRCIAPPDKANYKI
jgi:hypothetical protein